MCGGGGGSININDQNIHVIAFVREPGVCNSNGCDHLNDSGEHQMIANPSRSSPSQIWHVGVRRQKDELEPEEHVLVKCVAWPVASSSSMTLGHSMYHRN